jgi:glycine/D-amino acid oxidase-like deaminating enzyme
MTTVPLQSLWSATAPPGPPRTPLCAAQRSEVAIVGAGYTGLSAALHLLAAGRAVTVVEALEPGARASGANGGQVIPGVKHDPDTLEALFGPAAGARLVATVAAGPELVFELIARHAIACDPVRAGWIQPADSEQALAALAVRAAQWQRRGAAVEVLTRAEVARLTGSGCYCGGLLDRRGGTLQPLAYVRGLAAAVLRAGGQLYSDSPAHRLSREGGGWRLDTPQGSLTAPCVIIATNAYSGALHPGLRRSVVTVPSFQVASAPLPEALRRQILPGGQAASDTRRLLRYFRLDAGGRFVLGSRGSFASTVTLHAVRHHYRAAREIYPRRRHGDADGAPAGAARARG